MKNTKLFKASCILAFALLITACGEKDHTAGIPMQNQQAQGQVQQPNQPVPQYQPAPAPVIVQQESSSVMPALLGAAAGYMLGSAGNNRQPERHVETRVVERNVYVPQRQSAPTPALAVVPKPAVPATPAFTAPKAPVIAAAPSPAPKPAPSFSSGGYSSVKQSAPTYRSSPSTSFSSSRSSRR